MQIRHFVPMAAHQRAKGAIGIRAHHYGYPELVEGIVLVQRIMRKLAIWVFSRDQTMERNALLHIVCNSAFIAPC